MSAERILRAVKRLLAHLRPWLFAFWLLTHAADEYRSDGPVAALVYLVASYALYDYGKERGLRQAADALVRAFGHKARRR